MPNPDIMDSLHAVEFMRRWVAAHPEIRKNRLLRWMGSQVGLSLEQVRNLIYKEGHPIQPESIPGFCRIFGFDDQRREYFRRLVLMEVASEDQKDGARLHAWSMHAAEIGVPADAVASMLERDADPWDGEAVMLAALPLLRAVTGLEEPEALAAIVPGGPDPASVAAAMEAERSGITLGAATLRSVELPAPCGADDWETLAWVGALALARHRLLQPANQDRDLTVLLGSADAAAMTAINRSQDRLQRALRRVVRDAALAPPRRLVAVLVEQVTLAEVSAGVSGLPHPRSQKKTFVLPRPEPWSNEEKRTISSENHPPGRPCIYHYHRFAPYVRDMVSWRRAHRLGASASWFSTELGVSRTYANDLCNGRADLTLARVGDMAATLRLDADEAVYLEGLIRFQLATDLQDKARERLALLAFAEARGVRLLDGEAFRISAHWGAHAILALADLPRFRANAGWITRVLGGRLPMQDALELVRALLSTGLLVQPEAGQPRPSVEVRRYRDPEPELASFALQDSVLRMLSSDLRVPQPGRRLQGQLLALPDDAVPLMQGALDRHNDAVRQALDAADGRAKAGLSVPDRVVLCAAQRFAVIPELQKEPRRR